MFTIEELYNCSRVDYCRETGITPGDLIDSLQAEVKMLNKSLSHYRQEYREGGSITSDDQSRRAALIYEIQDKIERKEQKIKDIRVEFNFKVDNKKHCDIVLP